jgi:hypothetical protein
MNGNQKPSIRLPRHIAPRALRVRLHDLPAIAAHEGQRPGTHVYRILSLIIVAKSITAEGRKNSNAAVIGHPACLVWGFQ